MSERRRYRLREKVAQTIDKELDGDCGYGVGEYLADALMSLFAAAWEDGARWGAVDFGHIEDEDRVQLVPGDNPYRKGDPSWRGRVRRRR